MIAYLRHDTRRLLRNRRVLVLGVFMPTVLFLVYAGAGRDTVDGADTAAYLMVSMAVFGSLSSAVGIGGLIAVERGLGWNRTLRLTPLRPGSYALGKVLLALLLAVPPVVVIYLLGAVVEHVELSWRAWLLTFACTWLGTLPFAALGLVIGYLTRPESVQQVSGIVYLGLSLFGGLMIPIEAMPGVMRDIATCTPVYWSGKLARAPIFPGQHLDRHVAVAVAIWTLALAAVGVWRFRVDTERAGSR